MIISVQTPLHYEYILYLNAHCNGFMVNSQLHVTQFVALSVEDSYSTIM